MPPPLDCYVTGDYISYVTTEREDIMGMSNAERQALWRERQAAKAKAYDRLSSKVAKMTADSNKESAVLLIAAMEPVLVGLRAEGKKNMATMVPATVARLTAILDRLVTRWPELPMDQRLALSRSKDYQATIGLLPELHNTDKPLRNTGKPTEETLEKMRLGRERAKAQRKAWEEEKRIDAEEAAKRKRKAEALAAKTIANGCTPAEEAAAKAKLAKVLATPTKVEAARKARMDAMDSIFRQGRKPLRNKRRTHV
jgi:hypothetical protein